MKLPESFLEELRARTSLTALIGRRVRLVRSGRNWKGCCPFHQEKTPSFTVYDDGYHCFGCGAHGDAIGFVMQAQGASFMEAVAQLAGEAGLDVPQPDARAAAAAAQLLALHEVLALAADFYQAQLWSEGGAAALAYLRGRGLADATIRQFGLGWAGDGRGGLARALDGRTDAAGLLAAGLLRAAEDGQPAGEQFFHRVMFPIRDKRGRVLGFGGRTLGDARPKYVNSPETTLFAKRRLLYGADQARAAARRGDPVVVVEGYMDVIALHQAGFAGAVAPLGTALGAEQIGLLWELAPAPILCFDGDAAGARAAARAIEVALPLVSAERTLRFATLPAGEDPDTLVRGQGPAGFAAVLQSVRPFSDALFAARRETTGARTPEQRAHLRALLRQAVAALGDPALRAEYKRDFDNRMFQAGRRGAPPAAPQAAPRRSPAAASAAAQRDEILLAIAVAHPAVLGAVEEALGALALTGALRRVRDATLAWAEQADALDSQALANHLASLGMTTERDGLRAVLPATATAERAEACWWHFHGLGSIAALTRQVKDAEAAWAAAPSAEALERHKGLTMELERARRGELHAGVFED